MKKGVVPDDLKDDYSKSKAEKVLKMGAGDSEAVVALKEKVMYTPIKGLGSQPCWPVLKLHTQFQG